MFYFCKFVNSLKQFKTPIVVEVYFDVYIIRYLKNNFGSHLQFILYYINLAFYDIFKTKTFYYMFAFF